MIIIKLALENAAILSMVHKIWDRLVEGCFFLIVRLCAKRIPAAHIFHSTVEWCAPVADLPSMNARVVDVSTILCQAADAEIFLFFCARRSVLPVPSTSIFVICGPVILHDRSPFPLLCMFLFLKSCGKLQLKKLANIF